MDNKKEMDFEEFKMNRREGFLEGISFGIVVLVMIVLVIIMMKGEVANSNVFIFRTISFIIGIAYWIYVSARFYKVVRVQKAHPEWIQETSAFRNKAALPRAWRVKRCVITIAAIVAVLIAFFTLYKPGTGIVYNDNDLSDEEKAVQEIIIEDTVQPQNNEDFKNAMDVIDSLNLGNDKEAEDGE